MPANRGMTKRRTKVLKQLHYKLFLGCSALFLARCSASSSEKIFEAQTNQAVANSDSITQTSIPIEYHLMAVKDTLAWLRALPPGDTLSTLLCLNRVDRAYLLRLDTLVIPGTFEHGINQLAPFPARLDALSAVNKILLISYAAQAFVVYENGKLIRWGPASLGKQSTQTPTGLFATNWKSKRTRSTVNPSWVMEWYFNLDNYAGIGMHEYALPGYPASHGCVRLSKEDAFWLYHWADQWILKEGQIAVYCTPVVIFGAYPYGERKPWLNLADNNEALELTPLVLTGVLEDYLPLILKRQEIRDALEITNKRQDSLHALVNRAGEN